MKTKYLCFLLLVIFVVVLFNIPKSNAVESQARYFIYKGYGVYIGGGVQTSHQWLCRDVSKGIYGYWTTKQYSDIIGDLTLYLGIRVYKLNYNATLTQLTNSVSAIVSTSYFGDDWHTLNATWIPPQTTLDYRDVIRVYIFSSVDNSTWSDIWKTMDYTSTFYMRWNTEPIIQNTLINSTWNIYYTFWWWYEGLLYGECDFLMANSGMGYAESRIENMQFADDITVSFDFNDIIFGSGAWLFWLAITALIVVVTYFIKYFSVVGFVVFFLLGMQYYNLYSAGTNDLFWFWILSWIMIPVLIFMGLKGHR